MMTAPPMLSRVLKAAVLRGASDVHAKAGDVFRARIEGQLVPLTRQRLTPAQTRALASMFSGIPLDDPRLEGLRDFDCSWGIPGVGRFRVNVLRQRTSFMVVLRVVPFAVPTPEGLGLPEDVTRFAEAEDGLLVVAGPGGSGKTSTVAALVHHINRRQQRHILTLEDPIEYLHRDLSSSISQREIGTDTADIATGMQASRRQDPDVVVIGDLREASTLEGCIRAAEGGCLVIAAFSAADVASALVQLVATLPPDQREAGRTRLATTLRGVIAQRLVPRRKGGGLQLLLEWTEATPALQEALAAGAETTPLRKALEKAVRDGRAESFAAPLPEVEP